MHPRAHEDPDHSGRVLQGLTYCPTGAIVAAPTTSLPERRGGDANWDYRFAWLRDASLTLEALWVAACPDEASTFFGFLSGACLGRIRRDEVPQILFGIGGEHELPERTLEHLAGWHDSRPVRVGNGAYRQQQLDVLGEVLAAYVRLREQVELDAPLAELLRGLADQAAARWEEADHGIWEIRGERRHYLHSKLMCWVALDRAIALAEDLAAGDDQLERWHTGREHIREAILERGWSARLRSFRQAFDEEVDAGTGELLGNFPQAFSHVGLVTAAWAIHQAQQGRRAVIGRQPAG